MQQTLALPSPHWGSGKALHMDQLGMVPALLKTLDEIKPGERRIALCWPANPPPPGFLVVLQALRQLNDHIIPQRLPVWPWLNQSSMDHMSLREIMLDGSEMLTALRKFCENPDVLAKEAPAAPWILAMLRIQDITRAIERGETDVDPRLMQINLLELVPWLWWDDMGTPHHNRQFLGRQRRYTLLPELQQLLGSKGVLFDPERSPFALIGLPPIASDHLGPWFNQVDQRPFAAIGGKPWYIDGRYDVVGQLPVGWLQDLTALQDAWSRKFDVQKPGSLMVTDDVSLYRRLLSAGWQSIEYQPFLNSLPGTPQLCKSALTKDHTLAQPVFVPIGNDESIFWDALVQSAPTHPERNLREKLARKLSYVVGHVSVLPISLSAWYTQQLEINPSFALPYALRLPEVNQELGDAAQAGWITKAELDILRPLVAALWKAPTPNMTPMASILQKLVSIVTPSKTLIIWPNEAYTASWVPVDDCHSIVYQDMANYLLEEDIPAQVIMVQPPAAVLAHWLAEIPQDIKISVIASVAHLARLSFTFSYMKNLWPQLAPCSQKIESVIKAHNKVSSTIASMALTEDDFDLPQKTSVTVPEGISKEWQLLTSDGLQVRVSPSHPVLVSESDSLDWLTVKLPSELNAGDLVLPTLDAELLREVARVTGTEAEAGSLLRRYHQDILLYRQKIPGGSLEEKARNLKRAGLNAEVPSIVGWMRVETLLEEEDDIVRPHAPQLKEVFMDFCRLLSIPKPVARTYWRQAIIHLRRQRVRSGQQNADWLRAFFAAGPAMSSQLDKDPEVLDDLLEKTRHRLKPLVAVVPPLGR